MVTKKHLWEIIYRGVRLPFSLPTVSNYSIAKTSYRTDDRYCSYRVKSLDIRVTVSRKSYCKNSLLLELGAHSVKA